MQKHITIAILLCSVIAHVWTDKAKEKKRGLWSKEYKNCSKCICYTPILELMSEILIIQPELRTI